MRSDKNKTIEFEFDKNVIGIIYEKQKYENSKHLYPVSNWEYLSEKKILENLN